MRRRDYADEEKQIGELMEKFSPLVMGYLQPLTAEQVAKAIHDKTQIKTLLDGHNPAVDMRAMDVVLANMIPFLLDNFDPDKMIRDIKRVVNSQVWQRRFLDKYVKKQRPDLYSVLVFHPEWLAKQVKQVVDKLLGGK